MVRLALAGDSSLTPHPGSRDFQRLPSASLRAWRTRGAKGKAGKVVGISLPFPGARSRALGPEASSFLEFLHISPRRGREEAARPRKKRSEKNFLFLITFTGL